MIVRAIVFAMVMSSMVSRPSKPGFVPPSWVMAYTQFYTVLGYWTVGYFRPNVPLTMCVTVLI